MMGIFLIFYASLIGYLDLGYDIYKFVTKVLIWNDLGSHAKPTSIYVEDFTWW
jgi:hypothetical protein